MLSLSAIATFVFFTHLARADTWNLALVRCSEAAGELEVKEDSTEDDVEKYKTPEEYQSKWLGELVEYISPPDGTPDDATQGTYSHVHLYRRHPSLCGLADAASCEGKAYLVPEDAIDVGTTCGDYVRVRYVGKTRLSIGWVEKKSIGVR